MQAIESAVRKKKQILLSEEELRQQRARAQAPEKPSLLRRVLQGVRRSSRAQALEQTLAALREEVRLPFRRLQNTWQSGKAHALDRQPLCRQEKDLPGR